MIIFLYGEDSYRAKQKLLEIIEGYKKVHKSGLNLIYLDVAEKEFADFQNYLKSNSMFDDKKLIILKNVFSDKKFQEDFLENIKKINEIKDIIVIYENNKVDERTKIFKTLKKETKSQEFNFLTGALLKKWATQEFEKYGAKIDFQAQETLLNYIGSDLWRLENEIKKLSYFKKNQLIKDEDVKLQIKSKIENDIFKTIEALANKDKKQALIYFNKHLESGDNILYLLSMVAYQFKNILIVKELIEKKELYNIIAKKSGLHPFVVQKTFSLCNKFSIDQLKNIYQKIFQIDSDIKTGKIDSELALELLITQI
jgi:DNA polymerase-3 subunit delta